MIKNAFRKFFELEAASGIVLLVATLAALIAENSFLSSAYHDLLHFPLGVTIGDHRVLRGLSHWVNDGLMVVFFFLVGMEIKRELLEGHLASRSHFMLPLCGAIGGMVAPAAIFYAFTYDSPASLRGWAIPAATDIAFALGILSLLGKRIPTSLKVFLTALAILDDVGAILIIALFYSHSINAALLAAAGATLVGLVALNRRGVTHASPYLALGFLLWVFVLESGIHATVAGVLLAFTIPMRSKNNTENGSLLNSLEHALHPWVAFGIMPLFAFFNAGLSFDGLSISALFDPIAAGSAVGLFVGKQFGVFIGVTAAIALGAARLPPGSTWKQLYGVSILAGIGFTMSLFIGSLAYSEEHLLIETRLGVLTGSLASALLGLLFLRLVTPSPASRDDWSERFESEEGDG